VAGRLVSTGATGSALGRAGDGDVEGGDAVTGGEADGVVGADAGVVGGDAAGAGAGGGVFAVATAAGAGAVATGGRGEASGGAGTRGSFTVGAVVTGAGIGRISTATPAATVTTRPAATHRRGLRRATGRGACAVSIDGTRASCRSRSAFRSASRM